MLFTRQEFTEQFFFLFCFFVKFLHLLFLAHSAFCFSLLLGHLLHCPPKQFNPEKPIRVTSSFDNAGWTCCGAIYGSGAAERKEEETNGETVWMNRP